MLNNVFSNTTSTLKLDSLIVCTVIALICGFLIAMTHKKTGVYTKGFLTTISVLPFLVQIVIMLVNGNLGTGVAIMGAFSLVRFRSMPGSAKEIIIVFFAMVVGLTLGTGYALFAIVVTVLGCLLLIVYEKTNLFEQSNKEQVLKIVIPENLDYTYIFDDIFKKYTKKVDLQRVKMIDMGSMYELKYLVTLNDSKKQKEFMDELRVRNGNLKIILSHEMEGSEL